MNRAQTKDHRTKQTVTAILALAAWLAGGAAAPWQAIGFTEEFRLEDCTWSSRGFQNPYFSLQPGYRLILEGEEEDDEGEIVVIRAEITVLRETQRIRFESANGTVLNVKTRVVEERESEDGELVEISRNFFALCRETSDVYYFGEDVDEYEDGEIVSSEGEWRAGEDEALPGLIMPGTFLLGAKYFQEIAPGVALDRGQNIDMGLEVPTEAGTFSDCVVVLDTTALDPGAEGDPKVYCPGVGLVMDAELVVIEKGRVRRAG